MHMFIHKIFNPIFINPRNLDCIPNYMDKLWRLYNYYYFRLFMFHCFLKNVNIILLL